MKKLISGIVAVAMALSLAACEKETKVISLSGKTMGLSSTDNPSVLLVWLPVLSTVSTLTT